MASYKEALEHIISFSPAGMSFDGVSDRLLWNVCEIALIYLGGVNGWGGNVRLPLYVVRGDILKALENAGNKQTNAYRLARIGYKVALKITRWDRPLCETLKTLTREKSINLLHSHLKMVLMSYDLPSTMDSLEILLNNKQAPLNVFL